MTRQWCCNKIELVKSSFEGFGSTCYSYIINVKMRMRIPWQTKVLSNQETWIRLECFEIFLHSRKCFSHHNVLLISAFLHLLSSSFIFVFHVCCLSTLVTFILLNHLLWLHHFCLQPPPFSSTSWHSLVMRETSVKAESRILPGTMYNVHGYPLLGGSSRSPR